MPDHVNARSNLTCLLSSLTIFLRQPLADVDTAAAAQAYGKSRATVTAQPDGLVICEAEEFQVRTPGWQAKRWGENYYAATFANTFLSRKAFLAPAQGERSEAVIQVTVPAAGRYLALVRYEAAYRFETQFRVVIEQNGRKVLDRPYGARNNLKDLAVFAETENGSRLGLGRVGKRRLGRPRGVR